MQSIQVATQDGFTLSGCLFQPEVSPKAGIIINSATAVGQGYYRAFSEYLCAQGYTVLTYDYRGIGESTPADSKQNNTQLSMAAWGQQDFEAIIQWVTQCQADLSWHCIGHSVGGQLVGLAPSNHKLASIYCVAAQNGYWKHWGGLQKPKLLFTWFFLIPLLSKIFGHIPGAIIGGENLPGPIALEWARWCRNPNFITDKTGQPLRKYFSQCRQKMRFLAIKDDLEFAPTKAVKALQAFYHHADHELQVIDSEEIGIKKIGHFGFFNRHNQDQLWPNTLEWLNQFS